MITLPISQSIDGENQLEFEVTYGPETGDTTETWLAIKSKTPIYVHGPDVFTKEVRLTISGFWQRQDLNRIIMGEDFADVVESELKKCNRTKALLEDLQAEIVAKDNLDKAF